MVILENTKSQLKFRYRPYFIWFSTTSWMLGTFGLTMLLYQLYSWLSNLFWIPLFLLFNFLGTSLVLNLAGKVTIYDFDKELNSLSIKRRGFLKTKVIWYSLTDILDVQLQSTSWHNHEAADYQIIVFLKSGGSLPLNLGLKSIADKLETINLIRKFLGMPPEKMVKSI